MISHPPVFILLALFSGLSLNLVLQCGLGLAGIVRYREKKLPLLKTGLAFLSIMLLWLFFTYILSPLSMGLFGYLLLFPSASLVYSSLEYLFYKIILKRDYEQTEAGIFDDGLIGAALFVTVSLSNNIMEAIAFSFGFIASILLSLLILGEIRRRAEVEVVPQFLRGNPLIILSMGLLSIIFGSAALILFRAMGV